MYEGWKIITYNRNIPKAEEPTIKNALKARFDSGDWSCSANSHKIVICYGQTKEEIYVNFQEVKYGSENDRETETYHIVFESNLFGLKTREEREHQELCKKTLQKIPWKKRGFLLKDGDQIPISRNTILRRK